MSAEATRWVHKPTAVDAVRWDGDLDAVRAFIGEGVEVDVDRNGPLWVTVRGERTSVFPVPFGAWLIRSPNRRLQAISDERFRALYRPALALVG